jgi:excinuclease UvrABC helicase subunit UvrB
LMYYHRYLSLFVLEEFPGVVRDTARNIRVLDLCGKYATDESDRIWLEQYRPYITMMNAKASASLLLRDEKTAEAHRVVNDALRSIKKFFIRFGQEQGYKQSNEVRVLRKLRKEISAKLPIDPLDKLNNELQRAIKHERYEDAARLRDEIAKLTATSGQ